VGAVRKIRRDSLLCMGHAVARLVEALRYKPEGRGFDFFIDIFLPAALWSWG
jgi:hypothetical protein